MATKKLHSRIYKRSYSSGSVRLWADFRDFADVGGAQEAVKPGDVGQALLWEGDAERREKLTERANRWVRDRVEELEAARDRRIQTGVRRAYGLKEFAALHLKRKARGDTSDKWLSAVQTQLQRAVTFFGKDRELSSIRPPDVRGWVARLRETSNGRGLSCPECSARGDLGEGARATCPECGETWQAGTLSDKTVRDHLNSLSNLYRRAQGEEAVPQGYNPVRAWLGSVEANEKPSGGRTREADWLEPHEAALLLEAARTYSPPVNGAPAHGFIYELLATVLLTGGRKSEVLGLEVEDVSFDRDVIRFRPNEHRTLKTDTSVRTVPLWPQLREILQGYVFDRDAPLSGLLFPSPRRDGRMLQECRRQLDAVGKRAGFEAGEIRFHKLRHTYTAARIQTTEHGAPVALFTVARELGHSSTRLIERRYGHLLTNRRVRSEDVSFRLEEYVGEEVPEEVVRELRVVV
jgi:integrase